MVLARTAQLQREWAESRLCGPIDAKESQLVEYVPTVLKHKSQVLFLIKQDVAVATSFKGNFEITALNRVEQERKKIR